MAKMNAEALLALENPYQALIDGRLTENKKELDKLSLKEKTTFAKKIVTLCPDDERVGLPNHMKALRPGLLNRSKDTFYTILEQAVGVQRALTAAADPANTNPLHHLASQKEGLKLFSDLINDQTSVLLIDNLIKRNQLTTDVLQTLELSRIHPLGRALRLAIDLGILLEQPDRFFSLNTYRPNYFAEFPSIVTLMVQGKEEAIAIKLAGVYKNTQGISDCLSQLMQESEKHLSVVAILNKFNELRTALTPEVVPEPETEIVTKTEESPFRKTPKTQRLSGVNQRLLNSEEPVQPVTGAQPVDENRVSP